MACLPGRSVDGDSAALVADEVADSMEGGIPAAWFDHLVAAAEDGSGERIVYTYGTWGSIQLSRRSAPALASGPLSSSVAVFLQAPRCCFLLALPQLIFGSAASAHHGHEVLMGIAAGIGTCLCRGTRGAEAGNGLILRNRSVGHAAPSMC